MALAIEAGDLAKPYKCGSLLSRFFIRSVKLSQDPDTLVTGPLTR